MIAISLLVDDGVASRGHSRNLLDKAFTLIGVAVGPRPVYRHMCVMDFAGAYKEEALTTAAEAPGRTPSVISGSKGLSASPP